MNDIPPVARSLAQFRGRVVKRTFLKITDPPSTYLVVVNQDAPRVGLPLVLCALASRSVRLDDALAAFRADVGPVEKSQSDDPSGMFLPTWSINIPERGIRKTLTMRSPDWVVLKTEIVRTSDPEGTAAKAPSEQQTQER
jgi:hypothetical protein